MGQHGQIFFLGKRHQFLGHRAVCVGAVIQVEFADAFERASRRAFYKLGLHHVKNGFVPEPVVVVGAVSVQADKGHYRHTGLARLRAAGQQFGAIVGPRVGDDGAHAALLHTRQHISHRVRAGLPVPGFLVVVQVGVEQWAGIVRCVHRCSDCYKKHSCMHNQYVG